MGAAMAGHILDGNYEPTTAVHRSPAPDWLIDKNLKVCLSPMGGVACTDIVFTMVPITPQVEQVLFGEVGTVLGIGEGKLVIDMSSKLPDVAKRFASRFAELGCDYVDAPVSGGEVSARNATLNIMCGGTEQAFARASPLFG